MLSALQLLCCQIRACTSLLRWALVAVGFGQGFAGACVLRGGALVYLSNVSALLRKFWQLICLLRRFGSGYGRCEHNSRGRRGGGACSGHRPGMRHDAAWGGYAAVCLACWLLSPALRCTPVLVLSVTGMPCCAACCYSCRACVACPICVRRSSSRVV